MHGGEDAIGSPRLRSLSILVAFLGVCLGGVVLWQRSAEYSRRARIAEETEGSIREHLEEMEQAAEDEPSSREYLETTGKPIGERAADRVATLVKHQRVCLDHFARLGAKYRRAARQPWLPIAPDPSLPELPPELAWLK